MKKYGQHVECDWYVPDGVLTKVAGTVLSNFKTITKQRMHRCVWNQYSERGMYIFICICSSCWHSRRPVSSLLRTIPYFDWCYTLTWNEYDTEMLSQNPCPALCDDLHNPLAGDGWPKSNQLDVLQKTVGNYHRHQPQHHTYLYFFTINKTLQPTSSQPRSTS